MKTKAPSIEKFHIKINDAIELVNIFCECKDLSFIIKACRLKPYEYIFKKYQWRFAQYKWWFDEFDNSLEITKDKKVKFIYNDLKLDKTKIVCSDLYDGLSFEKLFKICRCFYFVIGTDEDFGKDCAILSFYGIDEHLRSFLLYDDEWVKVSPLLLGRKQLNFIQDNLNVEGFREFKMKKRLLEPCQKSEGWISCANVDEEFLKLLENKYPVIKKAMGI
jgi:hypothetical protein